MKDLFAHFYAPDDAAIAMAMQDGLVVPDTNVLLSLYKVQATARGELFGALEKLGTRLWIPHQVGLEFQRNRLVVIAEQQAYFGKTQQEFDTAIDNLCTMVAEFTGARFAVASDTVDRIEQTLRQAQKLINKCVSGAEKANDVRLADHGSDKILARLEVLLGDRVGDPMEPKDLEDAKKEAKRRVEAKEPPGYKDRDKPDPTGDFLIFKQIMNEAGKCNLPAVFITDDRKEDWYRREHGLTLGARYELREEVAKVAGVPFIIMTTETFLLHAKKYLNATVSDETVDQAKELPDVLVAQKMNMLTEQRQMVSDASMVRERAEHEMMSVTDTVKNIRAAIRRVADDESQLPMQDELENDLRRMKDLQSAVHRTLDAARNREAQSLRELMTLEEDLIRRGVLGKTQHG
ncbi:MAG TPA: PIN domain-containing protein [Acidobacteriaceae bacterium]